MVELRLEFGKATVDREWGEWTGSSTPCLQRLYVLSLLIFGAAWWKAAVIGLVVLGAGVLNFGARWIARGALLFFIYASAVWVDLLPLREWNAAVGRQLASGPVKPCGLQAALFESDARRAQGESREGLCEP